MKNRVSLTAASGLIAVLMVAGCGSSKSGTTAQGGASSATGGSSPSSTSSATASAPASSGSTTGDQSTAELLASAKKAAVAADQIRLKGTGLSGGDTISMDLGFKGSDASGSIKLQGGKLTVLSTNGTVYFKADDAFWKSQAKSSAATIIAAVKHRWIKVDSSSSSFASFGEFADKSKFVDSVLTPDGTVTKGEDKTVGGVDCVALKDGDQGTLYLAKEDSRPVQIASSKSGDTGELNFSYDGVTIPAAPSGAEVVAASALGG